MGGEEGQEPESVEPGDEVDGTGNGTLLASTDQDTGGPGQEYSVGEG